MKKALTVFVSLAATVGSAFAQPVPPPPPNVAIPLDTVVYALIFAGVLFGGYKLYKKTQEKTLSKA